MKLNNRGSWTLIGLLVVVVIVVVAFGYYFGKGGVTTVKGDSALLDKASQKSTVVGKSMDTAKSVDCRQRLNQIRQGITMFKSADMDGKNPPTLKDAVGGVSADYFQCPVTKQAYQYDPAAGAVKCPSHPDF